MVMKLSTCQQYIPIFYGTALFYDVKSKIV